MEKRHRNTSGHPLQQLSNMDKAIASAQERRFENIVKQAPVGITILRGKDMIVEMANDTYLQIVDRKESQFIGQSLYDVLPEVRSTVEPLLSKVFETGIPHYGYEFPVFLNRYGQRELTFFNFVYQALLEEDGQIAGVIVVANEVTSLVNVKRFIEESEREFRNMVMQSPIAMTIFRGTDFIIENANQTMLDKIWRMHESDVIGKKALDVFPELKDQKFPALLQQVFETGIPYRESEAFAIVVGHSFYFDFEYAPLRDREGKVTGILITVYDVTEKVITRQHVEEARERLQLAVEATNLANWDLDLRDYTILHSARMIEIMGYAPGTELTHQQMRSQILPEDLPVLHNAMETALQSGIYQYEARIRIPNGNIRWVKTQGKVVFNESGEPIKMLGTLRDITEEKSFSLALENEVRERTRELALKNEALEKMNAELNSFAYVSSHDLQEPLRKIRIFAERITETELQNLTVKGQDYFRRIEKAASTMQTLINDLLSYSRTSNAGGVTEIVSMNKILEEAREQLKEEFEEKKALLHSDDLGQGRIIPFQFKQLLINLLSNSLKFAGQGRQLVINLRHEIIMGTEIPNSTSVPQQQYHHFIYTDNGIGFDNQFRERIFEIFQRLNSKEKFNGTGIGLAIVKKIVSNHQGFIEAHGERDRGAQFDIWFPVL